MLRSVCRQGVSVLLRQSIRRPLRFAPASFITFSSNYISSRNFSSSAEIPALPGENVDQYLRRLMSKGNLQPNAAQVKIVDRLLDLQHRVINIEKSNWPKPTIKSSEPPAHSASAAQSSGGGFFGSFFGGAKEATKPVKAKEDLPVVRNIYTPSTKGLYIWGGVGQGKTMLMDSFYETCEVKSKTRVHFHEFLQMVHREIHALKAKGQIEDPLWELAKKIAAESKLICFDEMNVTHITDAMILKRLFEGLFSEGCIVVATSNREPSELYKGGLNRPRFLPFIDLLYDCCEVASLESGKDFRLSKLAATGGGLFNAPSRSLDDVVKHAMYVTNKVPLEEGSVHIAAGRDIDVKRMANGVALYNFEELCDVNFGTSDYLAIGESFHTIFIRNIPDLTKGEELRNQIRRFITLTDILYERHTRVIFDAAFPAFRLFGTTQLTRDYEAVRQRAQQTTKSFSDLLSTLPNTASQVDDVSVALNIALEVQNLSDAERFEVEKSIQNLVKNLDRNKDGVIDNPRDELAGCLYFHVTNYDSNLPAFTDSNNWWFSAEKFAGAAGYELFNEGGSTPEGDNAFAFVRTISRIREMSSVPYLKDHQKKHKLNDLEIFGIKN